MDDASFDELFTKKPDEYSSVVVHTAKSWFIFAKKISKK